MWSKIKDKFKRFWKWVTGAFIITALAMTLGAPTQAQFVTAPENNTFTIGRANYQTLFKADISDTNALQYRLGDKFIGFTPLGMKWNTESDYFLSNSTSTSFQGRVDISTSRTKIGVKPVFVNGLVTEKASLTSPRKFSNKEGSVFNRVSYDNVFLPRGQTSSTTKKIDIQISKSDRVFSKIIKIDSLADLGTIPGGANYLSIEFEIETSFIIDGWNRESDFEITDTVRLGDFSYIEPARVWDSFSETTCDPIDIEICETLTNNVQIKSFFKKEGGKLILEKQIPIAWLQSAQFPIWTDADVTYGIAVTFDSGEIHDITVIELDTNKFVTCYTDEGDDDADCIAGTVLGRAIVYGTKKSIDTTVAIDDDSALCAVKNDTDEFVILYNDLAGTMSAFPASTTGVTINLGTKSTGFSDQTMETAGASGNHWCDQLGTDKFAVVYQQEDVANDPGAAFIVTVGVTSALTKGTEADFESGQTRYPAVCKADTDKIFIVYEDQDDTDNLKAVANTVSGTTLGTFGTIVTINTDNATIPDCDQISADKVAAMYTNNSGGITVETFVATLSGTTITAGTDVEVDSGNTAILAMTQVDSTSFLTTYRDSTDSSVGSSRFATISGATTVTLGAQENFEAGAIGGAFSDYGLSVDLIVADKVIICYQDDADTDDGKCIIGNIAGGTPTVGDYSHFQTITICGDGGGSGCAATTTTNGYAILATTTQSTLAATSSGGRIELLDTNNNEIPVDLIFTQDDGTLLDFEIEKYASTTGELVAWIEVADISSTTAKTLRMYYGNASALTFDNPPQYMEFHLRRGLALGRL